jgi:hypothetical protein
MYTRNGERAAPVSARYKGTREPSLGNPSRLIRMIIAAAAALVLAGCGNLSLSEILSNESPGEFRLRPKTANLQEGTEFAFTATGGFTPYHYEVLAGLGGFAKDQSWIYKAPEDIGAAKDYIEVTIRATDKLGSSDTATVRVFKSFSIVPSQAVTMQLPGSVSILASGGVAPNGYGWAVDGTADPAGTNPYVYTPSTEGPHVVSVTDDIGNYAELTITVLPANPPLTIDPVSAGVEVHGTVSFAAFGGTGAYSWSATAGSISPAGSPASFTAPSSAGAVTVTLSDGSSQVTAAVTVTVKPILPLVLSPDAPTVVAIGDTVQFSATGGVPPYRFSSAPSPHGWIDPDTGLYTQKTAEKHVKVTVTDHVGNTDVTIVSWAGP